jgi:hypothetical protein
MQEVTGSVSVYNIPGSPLLDRLTSKTTILVSAPGFSETMNVVFKPQQIGGTLGPVITSVPFVGVDYAFGA